MKHIHSEVIKAWADGAQIQVFDKNLKFWSDIHTHISPRWHSDSEYRIKPKEEFLKYRVGLFKFQDGEFYTDTYKPKSYIIAEQFDDFVMWLTDEQTVNVGGLK